MDFTPQDQDQGQDSPADAIKSSTTNSSQMLPNQRETLHQDVLHTASWEAIIVAKETMFVMQMDEDAIEGEILAHASLISKSPSGRPPLTPIRNSPTSSVGNIRSQHHVLSSSHEAT
jgi:hypothetical protein